MRSGAQRNVVTAFPIGANGVGLVIISTDSKCGGEIDVTVGHSVPVGIDDFRQFGHLADHQAPGTNPLHAHGIVQTGGENLPLDGVGIFAGFGDHDISAPQTGVKIAFSVKGKTPNLRRHVVGKGEVLNEITGG